MLRFGHDNNSKAILMLLQIQGHRKRAFDSLWGNTALGGGGGELSVRL